MKKQILFLLVVLALLLSACGTKQTPDPALDPVIAMTAAFATVNASFTQTAQAVPTNTPPPTETPAPPASPTPTSFAPTVVLPVTIKVAANCRFGPDTAYAGPGGLRMGKTLEAFGRDASGQWFLVREPGRSASCWVNIVALQFQGDPNTLAVAPVQLLLTDKYPPPANVSAVRNGNQVTISWSDVAITNPKAVYPESRFFLELWLCNGSALTYSILASKDLAVTVTDQPGCSEPSHGVIHTATREGYSQPAVIPWP